MNKETRFSIRYLRTLDVPLPEIADFLRNRSLDHIAEMLCQQKLAVAAKRAEQGLRPAVFSPETTIVVSGLTPDPA